MQRRPKNYDIKQSSTFMMLKINNIFSVYENDGFGDGHQNFDVGNSFNFPKIRST